MSGGSISNGDSAGKFLIGDLVEKLNSSWKQVPGSRFSVKNIFVGKLESLGNKTGTERVGGFRGRLGEASVYTKFGHLLDALMGSMSKALMGDLNRDIVSRDICIW